MQEYQGDPDNRQQVRAWRVAHAQAAQEVAAAQKAWERQKKAAAKTAKQKAAQVQAFCCWTMHCQLVSFCSFIRHFPGQLQKGSDHCMPGGLLVHRFAVTFMLNTINVLTVVPNDIWPHPAASLHECSNKSRPGLGERCL